MADDLAAGGLQRGRAGVGGEMMLAGEPTNVADLAQERGGQHRPDAEQLQQAGLRLGDGGLDARLHGGDPLLQLADVGDEFCGQLPAGDRRGTGGRDRGQQHSGPLGDEVASGAAGDQVHQQPVQPVDGLGPGGDQVLAALGQQVKDRRLVLHANLPQPDSVAGGDGHRDGVVGVALAAVPNG
jgi:hypothetical protein